MLDILSALSPVILYYLATLSKCVLTFGEGPGVRLVYSFRAIFEKSDLNSRQYSFLLSFSNKNTLRSPSILSTKGKPAP
jgi:hypothetical protein